MEDIVASAQKIKRDTSGLDYEALLPDDRTIDELVRNFEILVKKPTDLVKISKNFILKLNETGFVGSRTEWCMNILGSTIILSGP